MKPKRLPAMPISEEEIDEALRETFPASDPPQWTLGTDHIVDEGGRQGEGDSRARPSPGPPRVARKRRQAR
jgi:hypothetical protein